MVGEWGICSKNEKKGEIPQNEREHPQLNGKFGNSSIASLFCLRKQHFNFSRGFAGFDFYTQDASTGIITPATCSGDGCQSTMLLGQKVGGLGGWRSNNRLVYFWILTYSDKAYGVVQSCRPALFSGVLDFFWEV